MTKGPDADKTKRSKDRSGARPTSSGSASQKGAGQGKNKKKGGKTTTSNVAKAPVQSKTKAVPVGKKQPPLAEIEASVKEAETPKRKVPKTLLYNPASVLEAAAPQAAGENEAAKAAEPAADKQPVPSGKDVQEAPLESQPSAGEKLLEGQREEPTEGQLDKLTEGQLDKLTEGQLVKLTEGQLDKLGERQEPKRKVPKTLLLDTASVIEAAAAAAKNQQTQESGSVASESSAITVAETEPAAPETDKVKASEADHAAPEAEANKEEQAAPEISQRKVPKTLLYDSSKVLEAAAAAQEQAAQLSQPVAPESSTAKVNDEEKTAPEISQRKVPKTLLYDTSKVLEAAAAGQEQEAQLSQSVAPESSAAKANEEEQAAPESSKRKVPKTLLYNFDPTEVLAAAAAAAQEQEAQPSQPDAPESSAAKVNEEEPAARETPKRQLPKTLLYDYDPSKVLEAAAIAQEQEGAKVEPVEEAPPELSIEVPPSLDIDVPAVSQAIDAALLAPIIDASHIDQNTDALAATNATTQMPTPQPQRASHAAFDDPPPELNIDSPPVRLFFEDPLPVEKSKRRVPRTLLYNPVIGEDGIEVDPGHPSPAPSESSSASQVGKEQDFAPDAIAPRRISTKKIAKTLLYSSPEGLEAGAPRIIASASAEGLTGVEGQAPAEKQSTADGPLDKVEAEKVVERYIARTMLDHEILYQELSKSQAKIEIKAIEIAKEKANEPFKPFFPIECKKMALPCTWTWDESYSTEKYRYCGQCQRPVYNFTGLEIADAEEIILKAENLAKFTLYKRTDGKFMTSDCPVAVKRRSDLILMSVGGILAAFVLVVYMATLPKPKPKPAPEPVASSQRKHPTGLATVKRPPGSGHYIPGKGFVLDPVTTPAPVQPAPAATTSGPDTDENPVWEFNTPQAGNQQIVDPRAPAPMPTQMPASTPPPTPASTQQAPAQTAYPSQQPGAQPSQTANPAQQPVSPPAQSP